MACIYVELKRMPAGRLFQSVGAVRKQDFVVLFLDMSKVFDSVDHQVLLSKLRDVWSIGIVPKLVPQLPLSWILRINSGVSSPLSS